MPQPTAANQASQQKLNRAPFQTTGLVGLPNVRSIADPDAALVEALKAQSASAFNDLVKRHGRRLLTVAMSITKNREDAEDVVQDAFLKVFKKIDSFRGASKFASWLTRIVLNQALMLIRSNTQNFVSIDEGAEGDDGTYRREITAGGYSPEQLFAQREFEGVMLNLQNVRKSSRQVMELRAKHGLSEIEIARVLSLTLSAVKARLYRGRVDLREAIIRRLRPVEVAQVGTNRPPTITRRERRPRFIGANGLASDSLSPARQHPFFDKPQSYLPYHFDPQLLTRPSCSRSKGPTNCP